MRPGYPDSHLVRCTSVFVDGTYTSRLMGHRAGLGDGQEPWHFERDVYLR